MLNRYLAAAVRHLRAHKLYAVINIAGLAIGLACFIPIALFVEYELSYDRQYENADRIHRISRDFYPRGGSLFESYFATIVPGVAALLAQDFPQIETVARIGAFGGTRLVVSREQSPEPGVAERAAMADNELFDIFDFEWLSGDPATALTNPFSVVLTESVARRHFGTDAALGERLIVGNENPVRVTGVIADLPENTHLDFGLLLSLSSATTLFGPSYLENNANWTNNSFYTYILLEEGADIADIQSRSGDFVERHVAEGASDWTGFSAVPVTKIHLESARQYEMRPPGSKATVYAFAVIGALILLTACINFMNLATALATQRAKEVGVRKAAGAERSQMVAQFLGEAILLSLVATGFALVLVELTLPAYQAFVERDLSFDYLTDVRVAASLLALAALVGIVAGTYPAFYLSAFSAARVLKGDVTRGAAGATLRKALVVTQFAISIGLVIATALVLQQREYAASIELGYDKDQVVMLNVAGAEGFRQQWEPMRRRLLAHPEITHVTASSSAPGSHGYDAVRARAEGGSEDGRSMNYMLVDFGFFDTYGIEILAGRPFSEDYPSDRTVLGDGEDAASDVEPRGAYLLNALAARAFGWTPDEAVGKWIEISAGSFFRNVRGPVLGVTDDVHFRSVHSAIEPIFYMIPPERMFGGEMLQQVSVKISGRNVAAALDHIDTTWSDFFPSLPLVRRFLNEDFAALYRAEDHQGQMLSAFSILAILIACLGLFGLAAFATERRTKEIGVRKVMGATVADIVRLFTGEFGKLVLVANVIAWPAAYFLMQRWLENFAYRIDISALVFVGAGLAALAAASLTVGAVAARAARTKPGMSLRYE